MKNSKCTSNQIRANCFNIEDGSCVYTCENQSEEGCKIVGMYGAVKSCPVSPLAHPSVMEGYYTPDTPEKIAKLSRGAPNASRDAGYIFVPGISGYPMKISVKLVFIGGVFLVFIVLFVLLFIKKKSKVCTSCTY